MNEEIFVGDGGKLLINDFKPSYTITMNHSDGECVGRFDFNGPKLVFTGDAEESAKVFVNYLAMIWEKRLQEEREAEREKCIEVLLSNFDIEDENIFEVAAAIRARK